MYNGIGLQTARGSGTNGYVQRNLGHVRRRNNKTGYRKVEEPAMPKQRKANKDILEHQRKRQVEVKCMELRVQMEERGYVSGKRAWRRAGAGACSVRVREQHLLRYD